MMPETARPDDFGFLCEHFANTKTLTNIVTVNDLLPATAAGLDALASHCLREARSCGASGGHVQAERLTRLAHQLRSRAATLPAAPEKEPTDE